MPFRGSRDVPEQWLGVNAQAVGLTAPDFNAPRLGGPWAETFTASEFNPQVTLRYRFTDSLSFYARYAEAFKIGGFDTGQVSIPRNRDDLIFDSEDSETFELGLKGTLLDGRVSFDVDVFHLEFPNLQTTALSPDPDQTSASINAGQRVRGLEFNSRMVVNDHLLLGLSGAFMDGVMTQFRRAGCTPAELADPGSGCVLTDPNDIGEGGLIDRSGSQAPRTPDWKFVLAADYRFPLRDRYQLSLNARAYISDGYIIDVESFDRVVKYNQHEDLNLSLGFGDRDGRWMVSLFARNLLEARPSYNEEFDIFPNGLAGSGDDTGVFLAPSSFTSYGLKFEYRIR
jgi:iron complex outermembrane receptor protein